MVFLEIPNVPKGTVFAEKVTFIEYNDMILKALNTNVVLKHSYWLNVCSKPIK